MPPVILPNGVSIPGRAAGESEYSWRNRRSVALYGHTLYQHRIAAGQAAGKTRQEAAGHRPSAGGQTPYQRRAAATQARYGLTPSQLRYSRIDAWLSANGYTPQATGRSVTWLRRNYTAIRWIKENSSGGGYISPEMIAEAKDFEDNGDIEPGFSEVHLRQRYQSAREFKAGNPALGNFYWFRDQPNYGGLPPANWWYYH